MFIKKMAIAATLIIGSSMLPTGTVLADQKCKSVKFSFTNLIGESIRIYKVGYYDLEDGKWRTNSIKNTKMNDGATKTITETLEYLGNEKMGDVRVYYKPLVGGGKKWSDNYMPLQGITCVKNLSVPFDIKA